MLLPPFFACFLRASFFFLYILWKILIRHLRHYRKKLSTCKEGVDFSFIFDFLGDIMYGTLVKNYAYRKKTENNLLCGVPNSICFAVKIYKLVRRKRRRSAQEQPSVKPHYYCADSYVSLYSSL